MAGSPDVLRTGLRRAASLALLGLLVFAPVAAATAPASPPDGIESAPGDPDLLVDVRAEGSPDLALSKTSDASGPLNRGDRLTYSMVVTNLGNETAHGVAVYDAIPPGLTIVNLLPVMEGGTCTAISVTEPGGVPEAAVHCTRPNLAPGASAVVTIDVEIRSDARCGPLENVADVEARDEPKVNVGPENVASHTDEVKCAASVALDKTGPAHAHVGDRALYRFKVTNTGDVRLYDVTVEDSSCDGSPHKVGGSAAALSPGHGWAFTCTHRVGTSDGDPVVGRATVYARDDEGHVVKGTDPHSLDVLHPQIRLVHTISPRWGNPGDTVTYSFEVTNTGDTPLSDVVITDEVTGAVGSLAGLKPGQSRTVRVPYSLPSDPKVVNLATVRASDLLGLEVTATDDAFVTVVAKEEEEQTGAGGTPFTGGRIAEPALLTVLLAALGMTLLATSRRRRAEP